MDELIVGLRDGNSSNSIKGEEDLGIFLDRNLSFKLIAGYVFAALAMVVLAFMLLEFREGALASRTGVVKYQPEFTEA